MVPSFVHMTVVAGEVVEVQIRVNLVEAILRSDVTSGAAEDKESVVSLKHYGHKPYQYRLLLHVSIQELEICLQLNPYGYIPKCRSK